jgi:hypothetical protein
METPRKRLKPHPPLPEHPLSLSFSPAPPTTHSNFSSYSIFFSVLISFSPQSPSQVVEARPWRTTGHRRRHEAPAHRNPNVGSEAAGATSPSVGRHHARSMWWRGSKAACVGCLRASSSKRGAWVAGAWARCAGPLAHVATDGRGLPGRVWRRRGTV